MTTTQSPLDEQKEWLGRGWAYPTTIDPARGSVAVAKYEADIRQSILIILGTARGERVMRADFGCGIHELVFDALDTALLTRIDTSVRECLARYEARIEVLIVSIDSRDFLHGKLVVELEYRVRKTNQVGNFVYPFYFREGGAGVREGSRS
jgi:phage baseplate assembly protein W